METWILIALVVVLIGLVTVLLMRKPAQAGGDNAALARAEAMAQSLEQQLAAARLERASMQESNQAMVAERAQLVEREVQAQRRAAEALAHLATAQTAATEADERQKATLSQLLVASKELEHCKQLLEDKAAENQKLLEAGQALRQEYNKILADQSALKGSYEALMKQMQERTDEILKVRGELQEQFKASVNELMDEKAKALRDTNKESVSELLTPVRERLLEFSTRVEDLNKQSAEQHGFLKSELGNIQQLNKALSVEAHNLSEALRGNAKVMGDWGEITLERVLQAAGLSEQMYSKQDVMPARDGDEGVLRSDFLIHLPDKRYIVIDSKVSITAYSDYYHATTQESQAAAARNLLRSIEAHVNKLAQSEYHSRLNSPEFTFMFMPYDPIFSVAVHEDPNIVSKAYQRRVMLVTPSTLVVALKVVSELWQRDTMARNQVRLAELAGEIYNKLSDGLKNLTKVGENLETAQRSYSDAIKQLSTGRGNLLSKAEEIKRLAGKKVKVTKTLEQAVPKLYAEAMADEEITDEDDLMLPDESGEDVS